MREQERKEREEMERRKGVKKKETMRKEGDCRDEWKDDRGRKRG